MGDSELKLDEKTNKLLDLLKASQSKAKANRLKDNQLWHWYELYSDDRSLDKGLVALWAYHCQRCGHIWLPKDYDASNINTLAREPPKACARCKSKYWNKSRRDFDEKYTSITRSAAEDREVTRNQTPEEREIFDKIVKSFQRKIRREERKKLSNEGIV